MEMGLKGYETLRGIFLNFLSFIESLLNRFGKIDEDGWIN